MRVPHWRAFPQAAAGLAPLSRLQRKVAEIRAGSLSELGGEGPSEVQPLVKEIDLLLKERETAVARARSRASDLAHGLKTPLTVLSQLAAGMDPKSAEMALKQVDIIRQRADRQLQAARLQSELAHSQLAALRGQLHPHFLFNSFNAISTLIRQSQHEAAIDTIARLSELLRFVMRHIDQQVLSFARGVEGARVPVHLAHVAREIQQFMLITFPKNITLAVNVPNDVWFVSGDPTQLNQVLLNLCVNARDAMPAGGRLSVTARNIVVDEQYAAMLHTVPAGRFVLLEVTDTGTGMTPEVKEHMFEPFFTTKAPGHGTGFGLSTVSTIVREHGGGISVESEPGRGSCFKVFLPAQADKTVAVTDEPRNVAPPRGRGECILLVDDDASILEIMRHTLESYGYRVRSAEDGAQAIGLYALHREDIAVVLTDMMMPVMDGSALIKAMRRINPNVRIIATSGIHGSEAAATAVGVKHFLAKPFASSDLLALLRRVLD